MCYQNEPKFNDVYSRNNLPKIKEGTYVINTDEFKSIETHWIALYVNKDNVTYFSNFGVEHTLKEIQKFVGNKKYSNKYLKNTSIQFDNVWIRVYWIYVIYIVTNYIVLFVVNIENLKKPKISYLLETILVLSIICSRCKKEDEKLF